MKASELELIHADLLVARSILNSPDTVKDNPYMTNGDDDLLHSHDMAALCMEVQSIRPNFSQEYDFIFQNARTLYHANELRYGESGIPAFTAKGIFFNANKLFCELEAEYTKETSFDRKDIRRIAKEHYDSLPKYSVKRPDLERLEEEKAAKRDKDITD